MIEILIVMVVSIATPLYVCLCQLRHFRCSVMRAVAAAALVFVIGAMCLGFPLIVFSEGDRPVASIQIIAKAVVWTSVVMSFMLWLAAVDSRGSLSRFVAKVVQLQRVDARDE